MKQDVEQKQIHRAVEEAAKDIDDLDQQIFGEVIGVAQALDELRNELDKVRLCLDERQFEKASTLGYNDVSHAFVFLQRTLAGLQQAEHDKHKLIQDIAIKSGVPEYEKVAPFVTQRLTSSKKKNADEA